MTPTAGRSTQQLMDDMKTASPYLVDDHSTASLWITEQGRWAVSGPYTTGFETFEPDEKRKAIRAFADQLPPDE